MTEGLQNIQHAILRQEVDPLEWCVLTLPIPCKIGLPFSPCELPNEYMLYQSDENYSQVGMKIYDFQEQSKCINRAFCMPSLRGFTMQCTDFYNNIPITAEKPQKFPFGKNNRAEIKVYYEDEYIGRIVESSNFSIFKGKFHELVIENDKDKLIYNLEANLSGNPCLLIPPSLCEKEITYKIFEKDDNINSVGEIQHMHYGVYNEFCSKADQFGITYPENANNKEKVLITLATIFIDYQWFENS